MQRKLLVAALAAVVLSTTINAQASLLQHLIATNETSVVTNGVGTVSNWLDDSGNGKDTLPTSGNSAVSGTPKWPSPSLSASGLPGVQFGIDGATRRDIPFWSVANQDSWLDFTKAQGSGGAQGKSGFAVLVAFKIDANASSSSRNTVIANHGNPAANPSFVLKYETGYPACYIGSGTSNPQYINTSPGAALQAGDTVVFAFNYSAVTGFWEQSHSLIQFGANEALPPCNHV